MDGLRRADRNGAPLMSAGSRFALGRPREDVPWSDAAPSAPGFRPFGLRFARPFDRELTVPLPPHRYCAERQMMITTATGAPLHHHIDDMTRQTVLNKDGKGGPQEDWTPDFVADVTP